MSTATAKKLDPNIPAPPPMVTRLPTTRMQQETHGWRTFEATIPTSSIEHLLMSDFWRLNAHKLQRGDHSLAYR